MTFYDRENTGAGGSRPRPVVPGVPLIDDLDREIIRLFQKNGRASNTDVARVLSVTETTVRKRVNRLIDAELIHIVAVPIPAAVGMTISAIINVSVTPRYLDSVRDALRKFSAVRYLVVTLGRYDLVIECFFPDQEALFAFVKEDVGKLKGVTAVETSIVMETAKFSYEWEI